MIRVHHDGVEFYCEVRWDSGGPGLPACWVPDVLGYYTHDDVEWRTAHGSVTVEQWLMTGDTSPIEQAAVDQAEDAYEEAITDRRIDDAFGY